MRERGGGMNERNGMRVNERGREFKRRSKTETEERGRKKM